MRSVLQLRELRADEFLASLDALISVYAAAMNPPADQLPGRRSIMERHAGNRAFRAIVASRSPDAPGRPLARQQAQVIGFAYGFRGEAGQWWHDLVRDALAREGGIRAADEWMADSFEIAEVHVHPDYQGRGTGRALMAGLTSGRAERTAVLSTMDADTRAHRLYLALGFSELLTAFVFPGADIPYVIMGSALPLRA